MHHFNNRIISGIGIQPIDPNVFREPDLAPSVKDRLEKSTSTSQCKDRQYYTDAL